MTVQLLDQPQVAALALVELVTLPPTASLPPPSPYFSLFLTRRLHHGLG